MATEIFAGNGATWVVKGKGKYLPWKIDGFKSLLGVKESASRRCRGGCIIQDLVVSDSDISIPVVGADDVRVLYTFGKNFGQIAVKGLILFGSTDQKGKIDYATKLKQTFDKSRMSVKKKAWTVTGPGLGKNTKVHWTNLDFNGANPEKYTLGFTLSGIIAPIANKGK